MCVNIIFSQVPEIVATTESGDKGDNSTDQDTTTGATTVFSGQGANSTAGVLTPSTGTDTSRTRIRNQTTFFTIEADLPTKRGGGQKQGPPEEKAPKVSGTSSVRAADTKSLVVAGGATSSRIVELTSAVIELDINGFHVGLLKANYLRGNRTDKLLRLAIIEKGIEWFGKSFFRLLPTKYGDFSLGYHHVFFSVSENEFFHSERSTDLDIYHNTTGFPVEMHYFRDSKRIFTVFGEIKPRMEMMSKQLDVLSLGSAPLTALQASLPIMVVVPVDALLVLKAEIVRKFVYDMRSTERLMRFGASVLCEDLQLTVEYRRLIFPIPGPRELPEELTFDTCSDMFLQYHFKEICVPCSAQLSILYTTKAILNQDKTFRGCMTFLLGKNIPELLRHDPTSIVQQEALRQSLLNLVLQIMCYTIDTFPVPSIYGLSFWSLKKCCQHHTRFESIAGVTDQLLLFFVVHMPLEPPPVRDKDEHRIGKFVNEYFEKHGYQSDPTDFQRAVHDMKLQLNPHTAGWNFITTNDYTSAIDGGFQTFCRETGFKDSHKFVKCRCQTFCRSECPNVKRDIECNTNNCSLTHDCLNRPSRSTVRPPVEVRPTPNRNYGLFASSPIQPGMFIVEYVGVVTLDVPEGDRSYVLEGTISTQHWWIDARLSGNLSRFANHSCVPNTVVASLNDFTDVTNPRKYFLRALCLINKGEEITFLYSPAQFFFSCLCMSDSCLKGLRPRVEQEGANAASTAPLTFSASTVTSPVHLPVSLTLVNSSTVTSPSLSPFGLSSFDASAVLSKRKLAGPIDLG